MTPGYLLGIDLGTSSTKTTIIDSDGRLISSAFQEYAFSIPRPGWAEMNPETWFQAAVITISEALKKSKLSPKEIIGIGITGLMHGPVCLDSNGQPLGPAVIWADQRTGAQVQQVYSAIGVEKLGRWTGNPVAAGFLLPTWLWIKEHQPEIFNQIAHLLLPKDYLRFRLTGIIGTEPSDASATSLFNPMDLRWSTKILEAFNLPSRPLPQVFPSHQISGKLLPDIADLTGLIPGTPVVYGGSDQTCQAIGNGIIEPGIVSCTIGTGGQIFTAAFSPVYDPELRLHLFCHAVPKTWHLLAATLTAGLSLRWMRDKICPGYSYQDLANQAEQVPVGSDGLFFLPYLAGERTPHMDPDAAGAFLGLNIRHGRPEMIRAVMEGVVFSLRQCLELILDLGLPVNKIVASGGGTNHPLWLQLQADIFNQPIFCTKSTEASAVGAAILAGVGAGIYPDIPAACKRIVRWKDDRIQPIPDNAVHYDELYGKFIECYPVLSSLDIT
jgi:xylulokinase